MEQVILKCEKIRIEKEINAVKNMNPRLASEVEFLMNFALSNALANPVKTEVTIETPSKSALRLDMEIPHKEFEADIDLLLAHSFNNSLTKMRSNLRGFNAKKFGFQQMIEDLKGKPLFSPKKTNKRKRTESSASYDSSLNPMTPPHSEDEHSSAKRIRLDSNASSVCSSEEFPLEIVLDESSMIGSFKAETPKPETKFTRYLVDRLKGIQRKKPKIDVKDMNIDYNENMKREFPGTEKRTEAQKVRREKNTIAARCSRQKNKIYEEELREKVVKVTGENITKKREVACLRAYADYLMEICIPNSKTPCNEIWKENFSNSIIEAEMKQEINKTKSNKK